MIQTVAMNSAVCSVETSPEFMAPSAVTGFPATEPTAPRMIAETPTLRNQVRTFDFLPIFVC